MGQMCSQDGYDSRLEAEAKGEEPSELASAPNGFQEVPDDDDMGGQIVKEVLAREAARIKAIEEQRAAAAAEDSGEDGDDIDNFFGLTPNALQADGGKTGKEQGTAEERSASAIPPASHTDKASTSAEAAHSLADEATSNVVNAEQPPAASARSKADPDSSREPVGKSKPHGLEKHNPEDSKTGQSHPKSDATAKTAVGPAQNIAQTSAMQDAMGRLTSLRQQLDGLTLAVSELTENVKASSVTVGKARTDLAQLEAELNKLQCKGIDAVEVAAIGDLKEQEQARAARRELVKMAEMLFDRIDAFFRELRSNKAGENAAVDSHVASDAVVNSHAASDAPAKVDIVIECNGQWLRFAGTYKLDTQRTQNNRWTWHRQNGSEIIFFSKTEHILIASSPEAAAKGRGSIRTTSPVQDLALLESANFTTYSSQEKKWCHDPEIIARPLLSEDAAPVKSSSKNNSKATSSATKVSKPQSKTAATAKKSPGQLPKDPFNLRRFCAAYRDGFDDALAEIENGKKVGCWSWYFFPVAPFVKDGVECGSQQNREWCLRDKPPFEHKGDNAARAFLKYSADGVNLRDKYLAMMTAVAKQLEKNITPLQLVGPLDDPKLRSSLRLFERVSRGGVDEDVNAVCRRALDELREPLDP